MSASAGRLIYRYPDLVARGINYTQQHLRRLEKRDLFPKRVKLSPIGGRTGAVGWDAREIDEYIDGLLAARDAGADTA